MPGNAELICTSAHCEVSVFEIADVFLGFQGHPENSSFTSGVSIDRRKDDLHEDVYQLAKKSLTIEAEQKLIAKWIESFFKLKTKKN